MRFNKVVASLLGLTLVSCGKKEPDNSRLADTEVVRKGNYVYFITPLKDLVLGEQSEALVVAKNTVVKKLEAIKKDGKDGEFDGELKSVDEEKLKEQLKKLQVWLNDNKKGVAELGLSVHTLIPTAFMLTVGAKISGNVVAGGAGFLSIGLVVVPVKVTRINKVTREVVERYTFRWSAIAFPGAAIGVGAGGGVAYRAGVGLVWGDLVDPKNFTGISGGISGNFAAGIGHSLHIGVLKQSKTNLSNLYGVAHWQSGAVAEASYQGFGGPVFALDDYLYKMGVQSMPDPTDESNDKDKDTPPWKKPKKDKNDDDSPPDDSYNFSLAQAIEKELDSK